VTVSSETTFRQLYPALHVMSGSVRFSQKEINQVY
jgi:hypothetical protein